MTIQDQLKFWHKEVKIHSSEMTKSKKKFLEVISRARNHGMTYAEIAKILDLSASRVQQLVRQSDGRKRSSR
jgi:DNA-directed RNA polymerase specialized sigma24 family protein